MTDHTIAPHFIITAEMTAARKTAENRTARVEKKMVAALAEVIAAPDAPTIESFRDARVIYRAYLAIPQLLEWALRAADDEIERESHGKEETAG